MKNQRKESHINLSKDDPIGKYVLTPGRASRVELIAKELKNAKVLTSNYGFLSYCGEIDDVPVTIISGGIGCPSTAVMMEEMIHLGAHTFIRIGTAGSYQEGVKVNDIIVSTGAIRDEGTTKPLVPENFPAIADFEVLKAIEQASLHLGSKLNKDIHFGITQTVDNFYAEFPGYSARGSEMRSNKEIWRRANVLGVSMQAAAMYIIGSLRKVRAAEILAVTDLAYLDEPVVEEKGEEGIEKAIKLGIEATKILIGWDIQKITASPKTASSEPHVDLF